MGPSIPEADWKIFREIHPAVLARFCDRILDEVIRIAKDTSTTSHERYLLVYQMIADRDKEVASAFNDFRRSTALRQLAFMQSRGLLTTEELARFGPETQEQVKSLSDIVAPTRKRHQR